MGAGSRVARIPSRCFQFSHVLGCSSCQIMDGKICQYLCRWTRCILLQTIESVIRRCARRTRESSVVSREPGGSTLSADERIASQFHRGRRRDFCTSKRFGGKLWVIVLSIPSQHHTTYTTPVHTVLLSDARWNIRISQYLRRL
jgi:hypothetical protein